MTIKERQELESILRKMRLPGMRATYIEECENAIQEELTYEDFLLSLVRREAESRRLHRIERMLNASRLPMEKTWQSFNASRLPRKVNQQVKVLRQGDFILRRENVLAFGNPGSGKTHLLCAIGEALIHQGHSVLFTTCQLLVQKLLQAKRDYLLERMLKRFRKFDAIIIDDIGYVQQDREEMEVLFTLLADRYERGTVMLTSNLPFSQWEQIFKDPMTTAAAIDRLVHHSVILELNIPSYRLESSKKKGKTG